MTDTNPYIERKILRRLEAAWSALEKFVNRLTTPDFNPLYHLGTLAIYLLIVITITGLYLTVFYRPGTETAYRTIESVTSNWFGQLMRSIHRYASDGLLLVIFLHALKTLLSDRFWGSRWLAWITGWVMVVVTWFLGTMGYWLVWDQRAQWLTEYLIDNFRGSVALTFIGPDIAASSFAAFLIVLFVHIFLPLSILIFIIIHILRLTRARIWSPRWVMALSTLALILVSFWKPALSVDPADMDRLVESVELDFWYLGFLPVLDRFGGLAFWLPAGLLLVGFSLLPWLSKGRHLGPATVADPNCTGCALCASECPYRAIEMHYREDDVSRFHSIAVVNEDLCTGCGLCVGTCATLGIELNHLPAESIFENGVKVQAQHHIEAGEPPVVLFTCQRQASLGSLPEYFNVNPQTVPRDAESASPIYTGEFSDNGMSIPLISSVTPCIGMVDVDWVKELLNIGVRDIVMLSCPYDDCNYREGPQWASARLARRKAIVKPNLYWLETAPGDRTGVDRLMVDIKTADDNQKPDLPDRKSRARLVPGAFAAGIALLVLTLLFATAVPMEFSTGTLAAQQGQIRVGLEHPGNEIDNLAYTGVTLPENASVDAAQIMGGRRYPVTVQVWVDGALVLDEVHEPRGLRKDGEITGMDFTTIAPGTYVVEVRMKDDDGDWKVLFQDEIAIEQAQAVTLLYDHLGERFYRR